MVSLQFPFLRRIVQARSLDSLSPPLVPVDFVSSVCSVWGSILSFCACSTPQSRLPPAKSCWLPDRINIPLSCAGLLSATPSRPLCATLTLFSIERCLRDSLSSNVHASARTPSFSPTNCYRNHFRRPRKLRRIYHSFSLHHNQLQEL